MQDKSLLGLHKTTCPQDTEQIARQLGEILRLGDVILLRGDLGAGKSTFARALIQSLCGEETEVPSPTFTLVQLYETPVFPLWHFDLYRLNTSEELEELGLQEAFSRGVSLIEWPERLGPYRPPSCLEILFEYGGEDAERRIFLEHIF